MSRNHDILRLGPLYLLACAVAFSVSVAGIATGLVLLGALVTLLREGRTVGFPPRAVTISLGALFGIYFLATILAAPYPHNWHKFYEELWIKLLLVAVPVLLGTRPDAVGRLIRVTVICGVLAAAYAVWQHFSEFDPIRHRSIVRAQWNQPAVTGFFSHHLSYGGQALIFFLLCFSWLLNASGRRTRILLTAALAVLGAALIWSFARSAFLGTVAGVLVLIILSQGRQRWMGLVGLTVGLAAALLVPAVRAHLLMLLEMKRNVTRLNLWESSWHGIQARPLLGFGPGNFESLLAGYKVDGYYETLAHSHNDLLMHGVNAGIPGILAALGLLVAVCLVVWRGRWGDTGHYWILPGVLAIQAGISVAGLFQVYQTDDEVEILLYFVLGCALALARSSGRRSGPAESGV